VDHDLSGLPQFGQLTAERDTYFLQSGQGLDSDCWHLPSLLLHLFDMPIKKENDQGDAYEN
jgi:hypothetical protein